MKNNTLLLYLFAFITLSIASSTDAALMEIKSPDEYYAALKSGSPVVAKFYAKWCGVCKATKESFEKLANWAPFSGIKFLTIDIDALQDLAQKNNIAGIPTFIIFDRTGKQVSLDVGVNDIENFEPSMRKKLESLFNSGPTRLEVETPHAEEVIEKKEPQKQEQLIKAEQPKPESPKTHGIIETIQAVLMSFINGIMSLLMAIVKMVKSFFGR